ncbi:unnamed protein product, partial [Cladocopium goreaui]
CAMRATQGAQCAQPKVRNVRGQGVTRQTLGTSNALYGLEAKKVSEQVSAQVNRPQNPSESLFDTLDLLVKWESWFPNELSAMPAQYMKAPEQARSEACVDTFHVTFTPESVEAVHQAGQKVASKWQSGFDIRKKVGRTNQRRKRTFKYVAEQNQGDDQDLPGPVSYSRHEAAQHRTWAQVLDSDSLSAADFIGLTVYSSMSGLTVLDVAPLPKLHPRNITLSWVSMRCIQSLGMDMTVNLLGFLVRGKKEAAPRGSSPVPLYVWIFGSNLNAEFHRKHLLCDRYKDLPAINPRAKPPVLGGRPVVRRGQEVLFKAHGDVVSSMTSADVEVLGAKTPIGSISARIQGEEIYLNLPALAPVGEYELRLYKAKKIVATFPFIVVFNPFTCSDCPEHSDEHEEYVAGDEGLLWQGLSDDHTANIWHHEPFRAANLLISLALLQHLPLELRGDVVAVSRFLTNAVGEKVRQNANVDTFHVTFTPESVEAVRQAGQKVASKWQSGFDIRKKVGRTNQRRKRTFKYVAEQNQGDDQDLPGPVSYSRSAKGEKQIRKSMCRMLAMDKVAFPSKPMFDVDTGLCRLKIFGCMKLRNIARGRRHREANRSDAKPLGSEEGKKKADSLSAADFIGLTVYSSMSGLTVLDVAPLPKLHLRNITLSWVSMRCIQSLGMDMTVNLLGFLVRGKKVVVMQLPHMIGVL